MIGSKGFEIVIGALGERFAEIDFAAAPLCAWTDRISGSAGVNPDHVGTFSPAARQGAGRQMCVRVPADRLLEVMRFLYSDSRCLFERLSDLTCVDYLNFPDASDRYGVTYTLHSPKMEYWLWVKCFVNDPAPCVPSVTPIWKGAEWLEREVWDLFGVRFEGHQDLRRIVTWDGFEAHPLRKDYPLRGQGEREDYKVLTRESA